MPQKLYNQILYAFSRIHREEFLAIVKEVRRERPITVSATTDKKEWNRQYMSIRNEAFARLRDSRIDEFRAFAKRLNSSES